MEEKNKKPFSPQIIILVLLLISLPLLVLAVGQKTNLLGQAFTSFFTQEGPPTAKQGAPLPPLLQKEQESFETSFGGWEKGAWMPPGRAWSLERVQEKSGSIPRPYDGKWEIAAYQDGSDDDGTVWLTKAFRVEPKSQYEVNLSFYLWSPGRDEVSQWSVVAYGGLVKPEVKESPDQWIFETIGRTGEVAGWKQYSYRKVIMTGPQDTTIWLAFGQHVNWETPRTYFWDLVQIEIKNLSPTPTPVATFSGIVEKLEASICQQGTHRLVTSSNEKLTLLKSKTYNLDEYLGKRVQVSGKITPLVECNGVLVDVTSLELLLEMLPLGEESPKR